MKLSAPRSQISNVTSYLFATKTRRGCAYYWMQAAMGIVAQPSCRTIFTPISRGTETPGVFVFKYKPIEEGEEKTRCEPIENLQLYCHLRFPVPEVKEREAGIRFKRNPYLSEARAKSTSTSHRDTTRCRREGKISR